MDPIFTTITSDDDTSLECWNVGHKQYVFKLCVFRLPIVSSHLKSVKNRHRWRQIHVSILAFLSSCPSNPSINYLNFYCIKQIDYIFPCVYIYIYIYICITYICICIYMYYICICIHTHIHVFIYALQYTRREKCNLFVKSKHLEICWTPWSFQQTSWCLDILMKHSFYTPPRVRYITSMTAVGYHKTYSYSYLDN